MLLGSSIYSVVPGRGIRKRATLLSELYDPIRQQLMLYTTTPRVTVAGILLSVLLKESDSLENT